MAMTPPATSPGHDEPKPTYRKIIDRVKGKPLQDVTVNNPYYRPVKAGETQAEALQNAINACAERGWQFVSAYGNMATMKSGRPTNHILHVLLCIFTLGLWLPIWLLIALTEEGEKRLVIIADAEGNVTYREGR